MWKIENLSCTTIEFVMHVAPVASLDAIDDSVIIVVFTIYVDAVGRDLNKSWSRESSWSQVIYAVVVCICGEVCVRVCFGRVLGNGLVTELITLYAQGWTFHTWDGRFYGIEADKHCTHRLVRIFGTLVW